MAAEEGEKPAAKAPDDEGEKPVERASDESASQGESAPSDRSAAPSEAPAAPKKKRKKKKKRAEETSEARDEKPEGPVIGPEGWERPNFVLDFPKNAELERLVRAFELGNYAFVREQGKKLVASSNDESVKRAARELLARIEPDPLVKILLALSVALFAFLAFYAYRSHGH